MGNRSKQRAEDRGAFGSKKFVQYAGVMRSPKGDITPCTGWAAVVRPNRGRNRFKSTRVSTRKGFRPLKVGDIILKNAVKAKTLNEGNKNLLTRTKLVFQRKGIS